MLKKVLAVGLVAVASADVCPKSASTVHAGCKYTVQIDAPCSQVHEEMLARLGGSNGWVDPHNRGTYTLDKDAGGVVAGHRKTGKGSYVPDKWAFGLEDKDGGCAVEACSRSQQFSIYDMNTNYCNLHNLYCGSQDGCPFVKHDFKVKEDKSYLSCPWQKDTCVVKPSAESSEVQV